MPGTIPLASSLAVGDGSRGVGDWVIEGLRLIGVDLAGRTAAAVAAGIDAHQVPKPGLYRWRGQALAPVEERLPEGTEPWLLFLHGTFSNTLGSFGALAAQSAQWRRLEAAYRDRILALDHHTLSRSPIENAEEVLARLPEGAGLHLVGYSRGGLIGELLCRGRLEGRTLPFDETELGLFTGADRIEQRAALERLGTSLIALRPGIERYVRVACPARGTTLASDRLDRWLNFVLNAVGLGIGAVASPLAGEMYDLVTAFLLAVIKERADASTIPGLEAMIPGAPLVRLLNRPGVTAATDLAVLEGDIEGAGILGRLKVLATDLFFREDHDLVVNTSAMDGGMARNPPARASFTQGPEVSHFTYFSTPKTAERVVEGLLRPDDQDGGFKQIPAEEVGVVTAPAKRGGEKRPVVFVLPGITGTVLGCIDKGRERRIWVDLPQLAFGGLRRLAIDQSDIVAKEPLSLYYGELCGFLGGTHDVRPWGYDWRRSILDNAKAFATVLGNALTATDQPVRIVAHSMGGLGRAIRLPGREAVAAVPRPRRQPADPAGHAQRRLLEHPLHAHGPRHAHGLPRHARFHHVAARAAAGGGAVPRRAADAAPRRGAPVRPGALDGVGAARPRRRLGRTARRRPGHRRPLPRRLRQGALRSRPPALCRRPRPDHGRYRGGPGGSGRAAHPLSHHHGRRRPGPLEHRHPARHPRLVRRRRAWRPRAPRARLPGHPRPARDRAPPAACRPPRRLPRAVVGCRPSRCATPCRCSRMRRTCCWREWAAAARRRRSIGSPRSRSEWCTAILAFARHPVMVGHYAGDTINGAERQLDQALGGRLVKRKQLGLYPGALGTNTVVLDRRTRPQGAIVVGLGDHADLAPGTLAETLRRGLLGLCRRGRGRPVRARPRLARRSRSGSPLCSSVLA